MRIFTVYYRPASLSPDRDLELVKEGFSWPAFVFTAPWALWHGMWVIFLVLLAAGVALELVLGLAGADPLTVFAATAGYALAVGYGANDWRRASMERRGFRFAGLVAARDRDAAARRYFDLNPQEPPVSAAGPPSAAWGAWP